ncbi:uncharacterized protein EI97DRAFT_157917 [Westerdykella ornata]|uniref:Uncharacterized protein n=1 Tax=Westerdykella ornata TaxID=318751 RepID=A0A6A6JAK0_WESOR|nr:uncharacterized protein EI97DRAFT_157917 [Westerdykella ornata]KAF2273432.1 hypothetical protein EI97DRAFT_157917 [Westerdykella ornata]
MIAALQSAYLPLSFYSSPGSPICPSSSNWRRGPPVIGTNRDVLLASPSPTILTCLRFGAGNAVEVLPVSIIVPRTHTTGCVRSPRDYFSESRPSHKSHITRPITASTVSLLLGGRCYTRIFSKSRPSFRYTRDASTRWILFDGHIPRRRPRTDLGRTLQQVPQYCVSLHRKRRPLVPQTSAEGQIIPRFHKYLSH